MAGVYIWCCYGLMSQFAEYRCYGQMHETVCEIRAQRFIDKSKTDVSNKKKCWKPSESRARNSKSNLNIQMIHFVKWYDCKIGPFFPRSNK